MPTHSRVRLLADVMLGSLAKWLRILGYDVAYDNRINDEQIIQRCLNEERIPLTRDTRLVQRRRLPRHLFIRSNRLIDQIGEVLDFLGDEVDPAWLLTRCLECNHVLESVSRKDIHDLIPPFVYRTQSRFKQCPSCRKVFWGGTHRKGIHRLALLLQEKRKGRKEQTGCARGTGSGKNTRERES